MSGYVKWEDVEELLHKIKHRDHYYEHSDRYMNLDQEVNSTIEELKNNLVDLGENKNYNYTINFNIHSNNETSAREFADELVKQIKLKGLS